MPTSRPKVIYLALRDPADRAPHQAMGALWLAAHGWDVLFLCPQPLQQPGEVHTPLGVFPARYVGSRNRWLRLPRLILSLLALRFKHKPGDTVFYIQGAPNCPATFWALLGWPGRSLVYHSQDFLEPKRYPLRAFYEKRIARRAGAVVWNEPNRARFVASQYRLKRMPTVLPTGLPKSWPLPKHDADRRRALLDLYPDKPADARLVMAQGAFSPMRSSAQVLDAIASLPGEYRLVFTGGEPGSDRYETTMREVHARGLDDRVFMLGLLPYDDLLATTACCDVGILLYPNTDLGAFYQAPGRLTEYIGVGLPIVASAFPGLELLTLKHDLGVACDPDSADAIAHAIRQIADVDPDTAAQRRERLRQVFLHELAYDNFVDRLTQHFER